MFKKLIVVMGAALTLAGCSGDFRDDFGRTCWEGDAQWVCTDGCSCYRECVMAAAQSEAPTYNTKVCVQQACDYKRRCVK